MDRHDPTDKQQENSSKTAQVEALASLLTTAGLEPSDLLTALTTLAEAKKSVQKPALSRKEHLSGQRTCLRR